MKELTGNRYGKWTVLNFSYTDNHFHKYWECQCDCGRKSIIRDDGLKSGKSKSCLFCRKHHTGKRNNTNKYVIDKSICRCFMHNGDYFIFDYEDYNALSNYTWHINKNGHVRTTRNKLFAHDLIMGREAPMVVDHINHNKKDNRKDNLRLCTQHQNTMNCLKPKNNTSGFKGVSWSKRHKRWVAYIKHEYKRIHVGLYDNKLDAALAYNKAALKVFGEFACLNQV